MIFFFLKFDNSIVTMGLGGFEFWIFPLETLGGTS